MCGSTRSTTSPSSSRTRRNTPWAAGCCGPKLMVKLRSSVSAMALLSFPVGRRLLVPRQRIVRAFPWREEIEVSEFLRQPDRLIYDALLLVVVAHLDETGERKILAQRMALESVVGEQPAHVRMTGEEHAVEIVRFPFEPVGAGKHADDRGDRRPLIHLEFHPDAQVLLGRQQMIDDVEAAFAAGPVDRGNVDDAPELASFVVTQKRGELHNLARDRVDRQLSVGNAIADDRAWKRAGDGLAEFIEPIVHCTRPISARWCRYGGSSSAARGRRRAAPRPLAGSRARRYRPARCDRIRARPNRSSGNSPRRWRTNPWRSRSAAPASGRRPCAAQAPSCWSASRPRSSRPTGAETLAERSRTAPRRSAASTSASSRLRSRQARRSSTSASRCAPS